MINYFFNYSGRSVYIDIIKFFKKNNFANPLLLFGDPRLDKKLLHLYPHRVLTKDTFNQNFYNFKNLIYKNNFIYNFFSSKDYLVYKDQVFKMMDRDDDLGVWNRLDRESIFNKLIIFWFNKIEILKPDMLIFCDTPHTPKPYTLYIVAKYLKKPIYLINQWGVAPCVYAESIINGKSTRLKRKEIYSSDQFIKNYIKNYSDKILVKNSNKKYMPDYMKTNIRNNTAFGKLSLLYENTIRRYKNGYLSKGRILKRAPIFISLTLIKFIYLFLYKILDFLFLKFFTSSDNNPYNFSIFFKNKIIKKKIKDLKYSYLENIKVNDIKDLKLNKSNYVYFSMQYEPETSTNPMGEKFYDQFHAILTLRKWLPKNIKLFVKEHPSQVLNGHAEGHRGRSQHFYGSLNKIPGIYFVSNNLHAFDIVNYSLFVASITGTVSLEAAYQKKKAIYFGKPWYEGLPNTYKWNDGLVYFKFLKKKIYDKKKIDLFLFNRYKNYSYPAMLNPSTQTTFPEAEDKIFKLNDRTALFDMIRNIFQDCRKHIG